MNVGVAQLGGIPPIDGETQIRSRDTYAIASKEEVNAYAINYFHSRSMSWKRMLIYTVAEDSVRLQLEFHLVRPPPFHTTEPAVIV